MMMPTVAAAAPTLIAYLAPVTKASTMSTQCAIRPVMPRAASSQAERHDDAAIDEQRELHLSVSIAEVAEGDQRQQRVQRDEQRPVRGDCR